MTCVRRRPTCAPGSPLAGHRASSIFAGNWRGGRPCANGRRVPRRRRHLPAPGRRDPVCHDGVFDGSSRAGCGRQDSLSVREDAVAGGVGIGAHRRGMPSASVVVVPPRQRADSVTVGSLPDVGVPRRQVTRAQSGSPTTRKLRLGRAGQRCRRGGPRSARVPPDRTRLRTLPERSARADGDAERWAISRRSVGLHRASVCGARPPCSWPPPAPWRDEAAVSRRRGHRRCER